MRTCKTVKVHYTTSRVVYCSVNVCLCLSCETLIRSSVCNWHGCVAPNRNWQSKMFLRGSCFHAMQEWMAESWQLQQCWHSTHTGKMFSNVECQHFEIISFHNTASHRLPVCQREDFRTTLLLYEAPTFSGLNTYLQARIKTKQGEHLWTAEPVSSFKADIH